MASEPVEMVSTFIFALSPKRMMEPSPNCLVIALMARSTFLRAATWLAGAGAVVLETVERAMEGRGSGWVRSER